MRVVSQAYDELSVEDVSYEGESVSIVASGHPAAAERLRSEAAEVSEP